MAEKRVTQGRMEPIRRLVRIGFLVPPGNPTVEVEMIALAPPNVSVHFTRMVAHGAVGAQDGLLERTRTQIAHVAENAALLAMVRPMVIAMAHTAMSATLGAAGTRAYLEAQGIEVVSEGRLEGVANIYDETAARARELARRVDVPAAQAVFLSGLGMPTVATLEAMERDLGKPVVSAAAAMMWNALRVAGEPAPLAGFGRLLAERR